MWTVISFILSLYITIDGDEGYFVSNLLTFFTSFLALTTPAWLYWISFWIWGNDLHRLIKNFSCRLTKKLEALRKNKPPLIRRPLYAIILIISILIAGSLSRVIVKSFFENRKITTKLSALGATTDEINNLKTKIKNHKGSFESFWDEKDFRSIMLRKAVSEINKQIPAKIDEITDLVGASTDGDRTLSYRFKVDVTYEKGKNIIGINNNLLRWDRRKYWCHDARAAEFRKMNSIIIYEYFSQDMLFIRSYLFDIGAECENSRANKYKKEIHEIYEESIKAYK